MKRSYLTLENRKKLRAEMARDSKDGGKFLTPCAGIAVDGVVHFTVLAQ